MFQAGSSVGSPFVVTSNNGGHSPEQVAELCVNRLIQVADTAPPELAQQARAFREQMLAVVTHYVKVAIVEDRKTVSEKLNSVGYGQLAQQIKDI
jgi:hypothetical protein